MVAPTVIEISTRPEAVTMDPFVADLTRPRPTAPAPAGLRRRRIYD